MPAPAQWGNQFVIDNESLNRMTAPKLMALRDGGFIAAWFELGGSGVRIQTFNTDGGPRNAEIRIPGETIAEGNANIDMTQLSDGGYVVTWQNYDRNLNLTSVGGAVFNADGSIRKSAFQVSKGGSTHHVDTTVVALDNGGFTVFYDLSSGDGSESSTLGRSFDASGNLIKDEFVATGFVESIQNFPDSVRLHDGNIALTYIDSSAMALHVRLRILKQDGTGAYAKSDIIVDTSSGTPRNPSIAVLSDGRIVVVWEQLDDIYARVFEADGDPVGDSQFIVNTTTTGSQRKPVVAALPGGGFAVAFQDESQSTSTQTTTDVRVVTFDAAGTRLSDDVLAHAPSSGTQATPDIITLADGRFVVTWVDRGDLPNAASGNILGQIFDPRTGAVSLTGTAGNDHYIGTSHSLDILRGAGGNDTLWGGEGDDILIGGAGADRLIGGAGLGDMANYTDSSQGVTVHLVNGGSRGDAAGDTYDGIENVAGSEHTDTLIGNDQNNMLYGLGSGDTLQGGEGNDTLFGGDGIDELIGGAGADSLVGGNAWDIASYITSDEGLDIDLADTSESTGDAEGDSYVEIDAFYGSNFNDTISGRDSYDELYGNDGADSLSAGRGNDWMRGDDGSDTLDGGESDDYLTGAEDNDSLIGGAGSDRLLGDNGSDTLLGGAGNDDLKGGASDDTLIGGAGHDTLDGGAGLNTAVFSEARSQYTIERIGDTIKVAHVNGTDTDLLKGVKQFEFADGVKEFINAAPTGLSLSNAATVENAPGNAVVGTLAATDADGDALTYSLAPGSSNSFGIIGNSLVVTGPLDFETKPVHSVTIQAKDAFGGATSLAVNVSVTNAVELTPFTIQGTALAETLSGEAGHDTIYGSGGHDGLFGEAGNDRIHGGLGNDRLSGGVGKDIFVFDTRLNKSSNVDWVADFLSRDDSIYLENKYFTKLGSGSLSKPKKFKADMFTEGKKAKDAEDRIVYDKKTGALYYDQDGTGSKAQVKIATISNKTKLYYHDFYVI